MGVTLIWAPDTLPVVRRGCYSYCWCNGVITTRVGVTPVGVPDTYVACLGVCVGVTLFGAPDTLTIMRRDYYGRCWCNGVSHTVWDLVGARPVGVHDTLV